MIEQKLPAIVAVGYNRPDCMKRLVESINAASYPDEEVTLIVSIDQSDRSDEVEAAAKGAGWNHGPLVVRRFEERQGLRKHILGCGDLSQEYGAVIILEDDLIVSPAYYSYVLQCLEKYRDNEHIAGISLYSHAWNGYADVEFLPVNNGYDAYYGQFSITWGECWTDTQWQRFRAWYAEHEDRLEHYSSIPKDIEYWGSQSWGKYFAYYIVETNRYYVIPYVSLSTNYSEVGEHNTDADSIHQVMLLEASDKQYSLPDDDTAVRYDMFFERMFSEKEFICGIPGNQICIDLNGTHRDNDGRPYLLTCRKLNGEHLIASFALQLRPVELNVIRDIPGSDLYLYSLKEKTLKLRRHRIPSYNRVAYELYGNGWIRVGTYTLSTAAKKAGQAAEKIVRRITKGIAHAKKTSE